MLRRASLLLEAIIAIAVFSMLITAVGVTLLYGQENSLLGGDRARGASIAHELLDVSRAIRDGSFSSVTAGQHGIALNASQKWVYNGTFSTRSGAYLADVTVTALASDWMRLTARSRWKHGYTRSGSVLLTTELTDWRGTRMPGDWSTIAEDGSYIENAPGVTPLFNSAAVAGNYAYVTSETSAGGAGLFVFDISSTTSPLRVASGFNLGYPGYGIAVKGKTLYVVTDDPAAEIRAYDITSPTTLAAGNLLASYDLPGAALALSLSLRGPLLYVGAEEDAAQKELYVFDVTNTGAIVLRNSLENSATINGIALSGTSAYLAMSDSAKEMRQVRISSTGGLTLTARSDYDVTGAEIGLSVAATGTAAYLGRQKGAIQELVIFNTPNGGGNPLPSPGPWYHEGSGSLVGVSADPGKCYAFLAAQSGRKALQTVDLRDEDLPELATYTSTTGVARGLLYDIVRDRVFLLTQSAMIIFRPGSSTSTCT